MALDGGSGLSTPYVTVAAPHLENVAKRWADAQGKPMAWYAEFDSWSGEYTPYFGSVIGISLDVARLG
tara:strand:+ start:488 stop:691 length:204 start_codon:yes stop_codon:yes gene_type:complete